MTWLEISRLVTLIASITITVGLYDQALKIWRTRSAKDFTATLVAALILNELAWLNYGFALKEWLIIVIGLANIPAVFISGVGFLRYRA